MAQSTKTRPNFARRTRVVPVRDVLRSAPKSVGIPSVGRFALILTAVILLFLSGRVETKATVFNADYKLGAMDQVRLKVFEWRAAKDEVRQIAKIYLDRLGRQMERQGKSPDEL